MVINNLSLTDPVFSIATSGNKAKIIGLIFSTQISSDAIELSNGATPEIRGCQFNFFGTAIYSTASYPNINHNIFNTDTTAISFDVIANKDSIINNDFNGDYYSIAAISSAGSPEDPNYVIKNNIFFNYTALFDFTNTGKVTYNLYDSYDYPGFSDASNIYNDPYYFNQSNGIQSVSSPSIDAGDPGSPKDP